MLGLEGEFVEQDRSFEMNPGRLIENDLAQGEVRVDGSEEAVQVEGRLESEIDAVAPEAVVCLGHELPGLVRDVELLEGDAGMSKFDDGFDLGSGITAVRDVTGRELDASSEVFEVVEVARDLDVHSGRGLLRKIEEFDDLQHLAGNLSALLDDVEAGRIVEGRRNGSGLLAVRFDGVAGGAEEGSF